MQFPQGQRTATRADAESFAQNHRAQAQTQSAAHRPGWYPDPWRQATFRWWDGHTWTGHTHHAARPEQKPFLPSFLSWPVVISLPIAILAVLAVLFTQPLAILLGLVPAIFVVPVMVWLDRHEPEPWSSCLHAFLWGLAVAGTISAIVNTIAAIALGDAFAATFSAPVIEEVTKALAIVWAIRRREVDGVIDGIIYAGWAALGFAIVEDFSYFGQAISDGTIGATFLIRAILFPFCHPLFTAWTGIALGMAIRNKEPLWTAWWGLALAIFSHFMWNGALTYAEFSSGVDGPIVVLLVLGGFVLLFVAAIVAVVMLRQREYRRFIELLPWMTQRYNLPLEQARVLYDKKLRKETRRRLDPKRRRAFDKQNVALSRLAALFDHPKPPDPACEQRLVSMLRLARQEGGFSKVNAAQAQHPVQQRPHNRRI